MSHCYNGDTCAAEFEASTPYYYSTTNRRRGPGHGKQKGRHPGRRPFRSDRESNSTTAASTPPLLAKWAVESIMVISTPRTAARTTTLGPTYFEPLTKEDVLNHIEKESRTG